MTYGDVVLLTSIRVIVNWLYYDVYWTQYLYGIWYSYMVRLMYMLYCWHLIGKSVLAVMGCILKAVSICFMVQL